MKRVMTLVVLAAFVSGLAACGSEGKLEFPGDRNKDNRNVPAAKADTKNNNRNWVK